MKSILYFAIILILCLFILHIIKYYFNQKQIGFSTPETFCNQKQIALLYTPESYFGIGDYIRGIIHIYQNENSKNVFINYETNDISKYLKNNYNNTIPYTIPNTTIHITDEKNYNNVKNNNIDDILYLYHNAAITYPIKNNILKKVKKMFTPNKQFKKLINTTLFNLVSNKPFVILHIRLNDDVFVNDRILIDPSLDCAIESIKQTSNKQIVVMSNSNLTKKHLCLNYNIKCIDIIPVHTGAIGKKGDIKDTLLEFFIMSKADHIYQYCENKQQKSGFSQRISEIYNIPITQI